MPSSQRQFVFSARPNHAGLVVSYPNQLRAIALRQTWQYRHRDRASLATRIISGIGRADCEARAIARPVDAAVRFMAARPGRYARSARIADHSPRANGRPSSKAAARRSGRMSAATAPVACEAWRFVRLGPGPANRLRDPAPDRQRGASAFAGSSAGLLLRLGRADDLGRYEQRAGRALRPASPAARPKLSTACSPSPSAIEFRFEPGGSPPPAMASPDGCTSVLASNGDDRPRSAPSAPVGLRRDERASRLTSQITRAGPAAFRIGDSAPAPTAGNNFAYLIAQIEHAWKAGLPVKLVSGQCLGALRTLAGNGRRAPRPSIHAPAAIRPHAHAVCDAVRGAARSRGNPCNFLRLAPTEVRILVDSSHWHRSPHLRRVPESMPAAFIAHSAAGAVDGVHPPAAVPAAITPGCAQEPSAPLLARARPRPGPSWASSDTQRAVTRRSAIERAP